MDSLITRRGAIAAAKQEGDWVHPSDWLPLPSVSDSEQKFVGLHAIFENANFVALSCQGAYTVDWGDGIIENFASGVTAYHEYNYATYDTANTTLCSRGYKQAIVTVTPQDGQNINNFNLGIKHNNAGLITYTTGWLDIVLSLPQATNNGLKMRGSSALHCMLEKVNFKNIGSVTDMINMFYACNSLQSVSLNRLKTTIYLANCKLSATALNNLFTSLGTVSGKTVTISNNYGASTCNRSIAITKGWTVTG